MGAAAHVHPGQLAMLYQAKDLADPDKFDYYEALYEPHGEPMSGRQRFNALREAKINEAKTGDHKQSRNRIRGNDGEVLKEGKTLYASIEEEGVKTPVEIMSPLPGSGKIGLVGNGHHRALVSALFDNGTREIPVVNVD